MNEENRPLSGDVIRVLHVDDETNQLEFAKTFIEISDPDIHMESVSAPKEALDKLRDESFDCILSDYQMPDMDGIELARRIRETSDIPIIIYTGRGSEEVAEAAFTVGINDYLRKEMNPSHYQVLAKRVRSAVENYRSEKALVESEKRYRTTLESLGDAIHVASRELTIELTNTSLRNWLNELELNSDIVGLALSEALPFLEGRVFEEYKAVIESGDLLVTTEKMLVGDKEIFTETRKIPIIEGGEVSRVVTAIRVVSESKRFERRREPHFTGNKILPLGSSKRNGPGGIRTLQCPFLAFFGFI